MRPNEEHLWEASSALLKEPGLAARGAPGGRLHEKVVTAQPPGGASTVHTQHKLHPEAASQGGAPAFLGPSPAGVGGWVGGEAWGQLSSSHSCGFRWPLSQI